MGVPLDEVAVATQFERIESKLGQILKNQDEQQTQLADMAKWQREHDLMHARGGGAAPLSPPPPGGTPDMAWKVIITLLGLVSTLVAYLMPKQ